MESLQRNIRDSMLICVILLSSARCMFENEISPEKTQRKELERNALSLLINSLNLPPRNRDPENGRRASEHDEIKAAMDNCEDALLKIGGTELLLRNEFCGDGSDPTADSAGGQLITGTMVSFANLEITEQQPVLKVSLTPVNVCFSQAVDVQTGLDQSLTLPPIFSLNFAQNAEGIFKDAMVSILISFLTGFLTGLDHTFDLLNNLELRDPVLRLEQYELCYSFDSRQVDLTLKPAFESTIMSTYAFRQNDRSEVFVPAKMRIVADITIEATIDPSGSLVYKNAAGSIGSDIQRIQLHQTDFFSWSIVIFGITVTNGRIQTVDNSLFLWPVISGSVQHDEDGLLLNIHYQVDYEAKLSFGRHGAMEGDLMLKFSP